ncbi:hypothetical protein LOAG_10337 [Loa loa]|nr:hypothetical protein LOAG_10337 [Loa loa]EFO18158.1 hypothetical protein LOAG_10337 [Loa loa]
MVIRSIPKIPENVGNADNDYSMRRSMGEWKLGDGLRRLSDPNMLLLRGVAILHLTLTIKTASNSCPHLCSCSQETVVCTGQGLLRIPSRIPPNTVRLQLMDNQIHMIESDAFGDLIALERL